MVRIRVERETARKWKEQAKRLDLSLSQWIRKKCAKKNERIENYYSTRTFPHIPPQSVLPETTNATDVYCNQREIVTQPSKAEESDAQLTHRFQMPAMPGGKYPSYGDDVYKAPTLAFSKVDENVSRITGGHPVVRQNSG